MVKCGRCWLHYGLNCMNVLMSLCGAAIIIYSLWLEKQWYLGVADLPSVTNLPRPWFIYISLSVGMAVCFTTIFAHTIRNCVNNNSPLCIYVVSVSCLLILEVTVVFLVFFKIKWSELIAEYIDEDHEEFKNFVVFHLTMCRLIIILIAVLQVIIIALALILWAIGTEQSYNSKQLSSVPDFKQSFLICPNSPLLNESVLITNDDGSSLPITLQICAKCGKFCGRNPQDSLVSYIKGLLIIRFGRRRTVDIE